MLDSLFCCLGIGAWFVGATVYYSLRSEPGEADGDPAELLPMDPAPSHHGPDVLRCRNCGQLNRIKAASKHEQVCSKCKHTLRGDIVRAVLSDGSPVPLPSEDGVSEDVHGTCPSCRQLNDLNLDLPEAQRCGRCGKVVWRGPSRSRSRSSEGVERQASVGSRGRPVPVSGVKTRAPVDRSPRTGWTLPSDWNQLDCVAFLLVVATAIGGGSAPGPERAGVLLAALREYSVAGRAVTIDDAVRLQVRAVGALDELNRQGGVDHVLTGVSAVLEVIDRKFGRDFKTTVVHDVARIIATEPGPSVEERGYLEFICETWGIRVP